MFAINFASSLLTITKLCEHGHLCSLQVYLVIFIDSSSICKLIFFICEICCQNLNNLFLNAYQLTLNGRKCSVYFYLKTLHLINILYGSYVFEFIFLIYFFGKDKIPLSVFLQKLYTFIFALERNGALQI